MQSWLTLFENRLRWLVLFCLLLVLGVSWTLASAADGASTTSGRIPSPREGFLAPDFTLELLGGGEVRLSELRGKPVVLNLWASWCPPCRAEMPAIQEVYVENAERGLQVLAVNLTYQDSVAAAREFIQDLGLTIPVPLDTTGAVGQSYQMRALPSTFFIDRDGVIDKVIIGGPMSKATLQSAVEVLFEDGD